MRWFGRCAAAAPLALIAIILSAGPALTPEAGDQGPPVPEYLLPRVLQDPAVAELSGLAASRRHPGVLYGINDSGGQNVVFAIDETGATVARLRLDGLLNRDWEALAPCLDEAGRPVLWIGDIGDNGADQERVRLIRISEPDVLVDQDVRWEAFWIRYPDGPRNAEALLCDPRSGELAVVTKGIRGPGGMYRLPVLRPRVANQAEHVMAVPPGITDGAWELSPIGEPRLVLTDYWQLHRYADGGWVSALGPLQLQREALAWPWLPGRGEGGARDQVYLGSEGASSRILVADVP